MNRLLKHVKKTSLSEKLSDVLSRRFLWMIIGAYISAVIAIGSHFADSRNYLPLMSVAKVGYVVTFMFFAAAVYYGRRLDQEMEREINDGTKDFPRK